MIFENAISRHTSAPALLRSLDASMLRQKSIANNIANINTPGYKRIEVQFESELRKALDPNRLQGARTDNGHMDIGKPNLHSLHPEAYRPTDPTLPGQINNVDIDMEMAKLAENQILYNSGVKFLNDRIQTIRSAIMGRA
ncbi:MAG: flagellar basal body rod protein FlgB [Fibrobacterota bacterium]|nr:flagellar basal body rod protein FlgB [Fibrobacterota bacterium]QQS05729.1 MAG: flagellar basal body rod protein FlgB [Fibrobacterota bacterium]